MLLAKQSRRMANASRNSGFGFINLPLAFERAGQAAERSGHIRMLIAQDFPPDRQGLAVEGLGLGVVCPYWASTKLGQPVERGGHLRVFVSPQFPPGGQGFAMHRFGPIIFT